MKKILDVKNLDVKLTQEKILDDISFDIYENEKIALFGRNGAGKTTLFKALNDLIPGRKGEIKIHNKTEKNLRNIYTIFSEADHQIIMSTVYSEIALGLIQHDFSEDEINNIIETYLNKFRLDKRYALNPNKLSTGEKKKLVLISALCLKPALLLLDEPFAGLDVTSKNEFLNIFDKLDNTFIMSTHEYASARKICNKAFVLYKAKLHFFDDINELLDDDNLLKKFELV